jgi:acyl-CoA reductase-like NAD-dependent aldehyde dehydrogenase
MNKPAERMGEMYNPATGPVTKRVPCCDPAAIDDAVKDATAAGFDMSVVT